MRYPKRPSDGDVDPEQDPLSPYSAPTVRRSSDQGGTQPLDTSSGAPFRGSGTQVDGADFATRQLERRQRQGNARVYPQRIGQMARKVDNRHIFIGIGVLALLLVGALALNSFRRHSAVPAAGEATPLATFQPGTIATTGIGVDQPAGAITTVAPIDAAPPIAPATGSAFVVTGTGSEGLFLRADATKSGNSLATLPEGTKVEAIGDEKSADGIKWKKVRTPQGQEGWVAANFLVAAP